MEVVEKNKISLFTAILININIMVGIGIFMAPSIMTIKASNLSFLGWPLVGLLFFPVVFSIAQITKFFPEKGSFYNYSKKELGKTSGFISGWFYFLGFSGISALQLFGLREVFINQIGFKFTSNQKILFCIFFTLIFCLLNLLSLKIIEKIQNAITIFKLLPIIFVIVAAFFYWNPELTIQWSSISNLKYTLPLTLFGFWGFESSCNISDLIKGDKKNPAKAIMISFFITVVIYTFFHMGLLHIMNSENLVSIGVPGFVSFLNIKSQIILNLSRSIITAVTLIIFISSIFGVFLSNSSNLQAMAENNLFPFSEKIKKLNRNQRPTLSVFIMGITTLFLLIFVNNKIALTSICNFGIIVSFILTLTSLLMIQIKKELKSQKIITALAFVSCVIITYYSWIIVGYNNISRILNTLPLAILGISGLILFKINETVKYRSKKYVYKNNESEYTPEMSMKSKNKEVTKEIWK